jgi:hypothetical protein
MLEKRDRDITKEAASPEARGPGRRVNGNPIHLSYVYHQTGAGGKALVAMSACVGAMRNRVTSCPFHR